MRYVLLKKSLRGFEEPDTSSQIVGLLPPGKYRLLQEVHTEETDYVKIDAPYFGAEDTWICSRWQQVVYAEKIETNYQSISIDFSNDSLRIEESTLVGLLERFREFEYSLDNARYPYQMPGFKAPQAPPLVNNCCTFVEGLIIKAWTSKHTEVVWNYTLHSQMMIISNDDFYSPVTALVDSGIGILIDEDSPPPPWTVIQGWRHQWRGGHTFIILGHDPVTDRILTLESNSAYKLNGVGYRNIGNIKKFNSPPNNWWNLDLPTWEELKSVYRFRKLCALKVTERSWIPENV